MKTIKIMEMYILALHGIACPFCNTRVDIESNGESGMDESWFCTDCGELWDRYSIQTTIDNDCRLK